MFFISNSMFSLLNSLPKNVIPLLPQQLLLTRQIQLETGYFLTFLIHCNYITISFLFTGNYRMEIEHKIYPSSCTLLYFQCGLQSTLKNILLQLLLNIINEPCFNILRTKVSMIKYDSSDFSR